MNVLDLIQYIALGVMIVALILIGAKVRRVGFGLCLAALVVSAGCALADDAGWFTQVVYGVFIGLLAERFGKELRKGRGGAR